jgi:hypothetical protein
MIHESYERSLSKRYVDRDTFGAHTANKTTRGWLHNHTNISPSRSFANDSAPERKISTKEILMKYTESQIEIESEQKEDLLRKQLGNFLNERYSIGNQSGRKEK